MAIDIVDILKNERLVVHFQPIVSLTGRLFFGVESLIRGIDDNGELIPPYLLFEAAREAGVELELDRIARVLAIRAFSPLHKQNSSLILFVNFESHLIDNFEPGSYLFYGELKKAGIPYENVVLEVKEDEIKNSTKLKQFCDYYREVGFNIALDDFGVGQSSFDRIGLVRPDIIKIDRSLVSSVAKNQIHKEIVAAICKMCHNIGALALAEGIESEEESACCLRLGANLMQGFYFQRPSQMPSEIELQSRAKSAKERYLLTLERLEREKEWFFKMGRELEEQFWNLFREFDSMDDWERVGTKLLDEHRQIEAMYIVDKNSRQLGATLIKSRTRSFYEPTKDGDDYSLKEYYIRAKNSMEGKHLTEPYLSLATGSLCRTYATRVESGDNHFVLCVDFTV